MKLQNIESNNVLVVALNQDAPTQCTITYKELIQKYSIFFHPINAQWNKIIPNYIAFIIQQELLSIHHVESYEVFSNPNEVLADLPDQLWETQFLYILGKAIFPKNKVVSGNYELNLSWCMIDTLLTNDTIEQAYKESQKRIMDAKKERVY